MGSGGGSIQCTHIFICTQLALYHHHHLPKSGLGLDRKLCLLAWAGCSDTPAFFLTVPFLVFSYWSGQCKEAVAGLIIVQQLTH